MFLTFSFFLFAISWHAQLLALVPVPLGDLVGSHADLGRNLHLGGIRPVWIPVEIFLEDAHLDRLLAHSSTLLPVVHVVLVEHEAKL